MPYISFMFKCVKNVDASPPRLDLHLHTFTGHIIKQRNAFHNLYASGFIEPLPRVAFKFLLLAGR